MTRATLCRRARTNEILGRDLLPSSEPPSLGHTVNEEVGEVCALQRPVDALPGPEVAGDLLDADIGRRTGAAGGHPDDPVGPAQGGKQPAADEAGPPEDDYPFH